MAKDVWKEEIKKQRIHTLKGQKKPVIREPWEMSIEYHNDDARHFEKTFKPLKTQDLTKDFTIGKNLSSLTYPMLATPKIEGVRCITLGNGVAVDGDLVKIQNHKIYRTLLEYGMGGLDGGITIPGATEEEIISAVNNPTAEEDFRYMVFDVWNRPLVKYVDRVKAVEAVLTPPRPKMIHVVKPVTIAAEGGVLAYFQHCAVKGYDGCVIRDPNSVYKFTDDESHGVHKLKLYQVGQGEIVSAKESKQTPGTLESFRLKDLEFKYEFDVKRGYTKDQRKSFWKLRTQYMGGQLFYKTHAALRIIPPNPSFVRIEV